MLTLILSLNIPVLIVVFGCCASKSAYIWRLSAIKVLLSLELLPVTLYINKMRLIQTSSQEKNKKVTGNNLLILMIKLLVSTKHQFHRKVLCYSICFMLIYIFSCVSNCNEFWIASSKENFAIRWMGVNLSAFANQPHSLKCFGGPLWKKKLGSIQFMSSTAVPITYF